MPTTTVAKLSREEIDHDSLEMYGAPIDSRYRELATQDILRNGLLRDWCDDVRPHLCAAGLM